MPSRVGKLQLKICFPPLTCIWVSVVEVWCDSLHTLSPVSP